MDKLGKDCQDAGVNGFIMVCQRVCMCATCLRNLPPPHVHVHSHEESL